MDDTAKKLRDMVRGLEQEIVAQIDPALLFEIEEKLGSIPEPRRGVPLHGMQQVMEMENAVEGQLRDDIDAIARVARLQHEIIEAVAADPRVVAAMEDATRAGVVDGAVPIAMSVMREELARRGLAQRAG